MLFLLTLYALAFSATACAKDSQGEAVHITVHAGTLVGTGLIEFNSLQPSDAFTTRKDEASATETSEHTKTTLDSAAHTRTSTATTAAENLPSDPVLGTVTSFQSHLPS
ncbi:Fc.00g082000.m01.CDS01 [Cosmosporella sp. VM-42]